MAEKLLKKLYSSLDSKVSFSSPQRIYEEAKKKLPEITLKEVRDFLETQRTYTLHKKVTRRFKRFKFIPAGLGTNFQSDLAQFDKLSASNDGHKYVLLLVEQLSRKIYVYPLKTKSGVEVANAFDLIFKNFKDPPLFLIVDQGREYLNKHVKAVMKKYTIELKSTFSQPKVKAAFAEVYVKILKNKLYKYMTENSTERWLDSLPKIAKNMNKSPNRITGFAPDKVTFKNWQKIWKKLYGNERQDRNLKPKFKIGQAVRMQITKEVFSKGYLPTYTEELFYIVRVLKNNSNVIGYRLQDIENEKIEGWFYENELVAVNPEKTTFAVEEIIDKRKTKNGMEFLVKWEGYKEKWNSWVKNENFVD